MQTYRTRYGKFYQKEKTYYSPWVIMGYIIVTLLLTMIIGEATLNGTKEFMTNSMMFLLPILIIWVGNKIQIR